MTELTDERVEELFTGLRADLVVDVRPPGTDLVRRTVRRRRNTASTVAVLAVVAVAGSTFAVARPGPVDPTASAHQVGHQEPPALGDRAVQALPPEPGPGDERLPVTRQVIFMAAAPWDREDGPRVYQEAGTPINAPAGTYAIDTSCVGQGSARVEVLSMPPTSGTGERRPDRSRAQTAGVFDVSCSAAPSSVQLTVVQAADGYLRLDLNARSATAGTAAVAFMITSRHTVVGRNMRRAYEALAAANPQVPMRNWMPQHEPPGTMAFARSGGGRRTAQVVCVGTGVVTVVFENDNASIRRPITCDLTARVQTFAVPAAKVSQHVSAQMDAAGRDRAGYALLVPTLNN